MIASLLEVVGSDAVIHNPGLALLRLVDYAYVEPFYLKQPPQPQAFELEQQDMVAHTVVDWINGDYCR